MTSRLQGDALLQVGVPLVSAPKTGVLTAQGSPPGLAVIVPVLIVPAAPADGFMLTPAVLKSLKPRRNRLNCCALSTGGQGQIMSGVPL